MPIRKQKPRSPGVRFQTISGFDEITKPEPEKSLLVSISRSGGRNNPYIASLFKFGFFTHSLTL
ncbi:hypothetical protein OAT06_01440 [Nitrospinaceae bacterium]|nr:hypothetical protein [Nitrospinaceae bacterium]